MNKNCDNFITQLNDLLDNNIENIEKEELLVHLKTCKSCNQELQELQNTLKAVQSLQKISIPEARDSFASEIILQLESEKTSNKTILLNNYKYIAAGVISLILAGVIIININGSRPDSISLSTDNVEITDTYISDYDYIIYNQDTSILAEAGLPTDEWGLLDLDKL
jgi:hypothetical protein